MRRGIEPAIAAEIIRSTRSPLLSSAGERQSFRWRQDVYAAHSVAN
jgi:hypothetical protein